MSEQESAESPRVMVDIETLGLEPGSAILSIGAVTFTENGLGEEFYQEVSLTSCDEHGLEIDAETVEWWLEQDDTVKSVLTGGDSLEYALKAFSEFYSGAEEIWANSPSFDCEHLEAAYDAVGLTEPWEFYEERDVRTIKELPCAVEVLHEGDEHDALDDAKHQARIVSETLQRLSKLEATEVEA